MFEIIDLILGTIMLTDTGNSPTARSVRGFVFWCAVGYAALFIGLAVVVALHLTGTI